VLLKRMKVDARTFQEMVATLEQQGDIEIMLTKRPGWSARAYRLKETQR
jgi:hypothetical protein